MRTVPSAAVTRTVTVLLPVTRLVVPKISTIASTSEAVAATVMRAVPCGRLMVEPATTPSPLAVNTLRLVLLLSGVT